MKVDRLVSILMLLLEKKKVSAEALAETFEVSKRTIYRDIDALCMAGIPIRTTPGVGGGIEIMPGYKVDKNVFTTGDLSTLLQGLSTLSDISGNEAVLHTLAKINSLIPPEQADALRMRASQISINMDPWMGNGDIRTNLDRIRIALMDAHTLTFQYFSRRSGLQRRTVEPCRLVNKNGSWYLYAFCRLRQEHRLFKLSRMIDTSVDTDTFSPEPFPPPQLDVDPITAPLQMDITLRIHSSLAERVLDHCSFHRFQPDGDEHYLVTFPFIDRDYYYDLLLSFGSGCVCLGPPEVREGLVRRLRQLQTQYD